MLDEERRDRVRALRHRSGVPVQRGLVPEDRLEVLDRHRRDRAGVERAAEALPQQVRRLERPLHRNLLVEEHPEQQRERIGREQAVGGFVRRERQRRGHGREGSARRLSWPVPADRTWPSGRVPQTDSDEQGRGLPEQRREDPELAAEQRYVDAAYARLESMRAAAERVRAAYSDVRAGGTHQARLERDIAWDVTQRRLADLDIG